MRIRYILGGILIVGASFAASLWALEKLWPSSGAIGLDTRPKLVEVPPLKPVSRTSFIVAPVAVALPAIQRALDRAAPRDLVGTSDNPVSRLLSKADIGITVARGLLAVSGQPKVMTVSTPLTGSLRVTGELAGQAGKLAGGITSLLGDALGSDVKKFGSKVEKYTGQVLDQRAEVRGNVTVYSRPEITPAWRLAPNLTGRVAIANTTLSVAGVRINVAEEVRPLVDKMVDQQIAKLETALRNDPFIEAAARAEWAKMCRAIPLGGGDTGLPRLWLELKPTRAVAAQPVVGARDATLTVGVQADTRIVGEQTRPACPFPSRLELVAPMNRGSMAIGVPIDVPFTEVNKLLEAQLKGRRFPNDGSAPVEVEVLKANIAASGERLLISLRVKAREQKSWFGFGAEATLHIWGRPELDRRLQVLRLTDTSLAVESQAAFGLLGAAARAAMPYLQDALAENAVVDLKPFTADARRKIAAALRDFRQSGAGVLVDAAVNDLRLTGIEFDARTLRITAEAAGTVQVAVSDLPKL